MQNSVFFNKFLGRNGTSAKEFWFACEFLFVTRASKRQTWQDAHLQRQSYVDEMLGRRVTRTIELSNDQLRSMCLDSIWGLVDFRMPLELFCTRLKAERRKIIRANKRQIWHYLALPSNRPTAATFATGIGAFPVDYESLLVCPATPEEMMELARYRVMHSADALEVAA